MKPNETWDNGTFSTRTSVQDFFRQEYRDQKFFKAVGRFLDVGPFFVRFYFQLYHFQSLHRTTWAAQRYTYLSSRTTAELLRCHKHPMVILQDLHIPIQTTIQDPTFKRFFEECRGRRLFERALFKKRRLLYCNFMRSGECELLFLDPLSHGTGGSPARDIVGWMFVPAINGMGWMVVFFWV